MKNVTRMLMMALLSVAALAQADQGSQCEPFMITVAVSVGTYDRDDIAMQSLNKEASIRCYEHQFIIDNSSIKRNRYQIANTGFNPKFADRVTAKVSCLNY